MKLMTINTHSLVEENYEEKLEYFVEYLEKNLCDVVAMQEVNQHTLKPQVLLDDDFYVKASEDVVIKEDNHIYNVVKRLKKRDKNYYWTWVPIKLGYGIYDEGIGLISKEKPVDVVSFYISKSDDYNNWKVRKVIGIKIKVNSRYRWYFSIHLGWYNDEEEPFTYQFEKLKEKLKSICKEDEEIYLMGDFNNPADIKDEGYDKIISSNWYDTYSLAKKKDSGITVAGLIDGWKEHKNLTQMRIDFIFTNRKIEVESSKTVFTGKNEKIISDHFGVEIDIVD